MSYENWQEFVEIHGSKLPELWRHNPYIISITTGEEPFDLLIEGLKTDSIIANKFTINISVIQMPYKLPKIIEIFKTLEEYGKYYALELGISDLLPSSDQTKSFFKLLTSKKCRIRSLETNALLSANSTSLFKKFLEKNKSIVNLDLRLNLPAKNLSLHSIKGLVGLKKNKTVKRLKLSGVENESEIAAILAENHTITCLEFIGPSLTIEEHLLTALAKMGSLELLKFRIGHVRLKHYRSLSEAISGNKFLEKIDFYDNSADLIERNEETELLATTIASHPTLRKLILPGMLICPLIKTISTNTVIEVLEVPLKQLMVDDEMNKSLLSMKSLRKLIFRAREDTEHRGNFDPLDLGKLVEPSSPIQTLVFENGLRFAPTRELIDTLIHHTSIQQIKIKEFYYWNDFVYASSRNPFLQVRCYPRGQANLDKLRIFNMDRAKLLTNFKAVVHCLSILRTIYLTKDRGVFATIPSEILFQILQYVFQRDSNPYSKQVTFDANQMKKLIQIASDRSKIGKEADARKRLQALWIEDNVCDICLK